MRTVVATADPTGCRLQTLVERGAPASRLEQKIGAESAVVNSDPAKTGIG